MLYHWWLTELTNNGWATGKNVFSLDELDLIKNIGKDSNLATPETPFVNMNVVNKDYRSCKTSFIRADIGSNQWIFRRLTDVLFDINRTFFNFELEYIQSLQFTEYYQGDQYRSHTDIESSSERMRKLSFSLQLDDENSYKGGDLKIYYSDIPFIASKEKGSMTVFPSYALHSVDPVFEGTRYSLVGWICGPKFR